MTLCEKAAASVSEVTHLRPLPDVLPVSDMIITARPRLLSVTGECCAPAGPWECITCRNVISLA